MATGTRDGRRRRLYLDFDGYFAAVEEQAAPALHGRPVAVLPYPEARTCVISANAAAKRHGVGTGTGVDEARRRCPGLALVSQRPALYVRVQRRIAHAVNAEIPIDAVCSVDELCCELGARDQAQDVGRRIKARLRAAVGPRVTSIAAARTMFRSASAGRCSAVRRRRTWRRFTLRFIRSGGPNGRCSSSARQGGRGAGEICSRAVIPPRSPTWSR